MEVTIPELRKARLIVRYMPQDIPADTLVDNTLDQNPELEMASGEIETRFKFTTKREQSNMVNEVGPETRKKLVAKYIQNTDY